MKAPTIIFKGSGWASSSRNSGSGKSFSVPKNIEKNLLDKIEQGSITDSEIEMCIDSGDRQIKQAMEKKINEGYRKKKYLDSEFGAGAFDGIDNQGNYYKDTTLPFNNLTQS